MTSVILDTSALLALINQEKGCDVVKGVLADSIISSVNVAEVVTVMARCNIEEQEIRSIISELVKGVIAFNVEQAYIAGYLEKISRDHKLSLSLGDRVCLALGQHLNMPVYTADQKWKEIPNCKIVIELIR